MTITYKDTDLKTHELILSDALYVEINGIQVTHVEEFEIICKAENPLIVQPVASNVVQIKSS